MCYRYVVIVSFSVDAVVARYKHEHIVEGLSLKEPVSRVSEIVFGFILQSNRYPLITVGSMNSLVPDIYPPRFSFLRLGIILDTSYNKL